MEGLAKLTSFVRYYQLCGFSPFRIQIDPQTRKFQQFTYSFRHPVTWWFFLVKIIFLGGLAAIFYSVKSASILSENKEEATHLDLLNISVVLFCTTIFIIVQLNILNYSTLAEAIEYIKKADQILDSISSATLCKDSIIRRTLAGIVFSFSWAGLILWEIEIWYVIIGVLSSLYMNCWLLFIDLGCHILAHRINVLNRYLSDQSDYNPQVPSSQCAVSPHRGTEAFQTVRQKQDVASKLKLIQNVYNILCRSADKFISYNSVVVFFIFTIKTISFIICTYFAVYGYMHTDYALVKKGLLLFVSETLFFLIIFNAADSPVNEVVRLREQIINIPKRRLLTNNDHLQIISCAMTITKDRVQLIAGRMFVIGIATVPAIVGTVITYVITIITFKNN